MEYEGKHSALVDETTWQVVQDVLSGRRLAGDRSWRHDHYLKGSLFCARCDSRMGVSHSQGKNGSIYPYFYCLGRNKKRTECDLPYLPLEQVEEHLIAHWQTRKFDPELISVIEASVSEEIAAKRATDEQLLVSQRQRLQKLEKQRDKLIDAYLAGAIPVKNLKQRQEAVAVEEREAQRLLELASVNHELLEERLEIALGLLEHCARLYLTADEETRRSLNQVFFDSVFMDSNGVKEVVLNPPFAELENRAIGLADDMDDDDPEGGPDDPGPNGGGDLSRSLQDEAHRRTDGLASERTNPEVSRPRGSNLLLLAAGVGFEPTRRFHA